MLVKKVEVSVTLPLLDLAGVVEQMAALENFLFILCRFREVPKYFREIGMRLEIADHDSPVRAAYSDKFPYREQRVAYVSDHEIAHDTIEEVVGKWKRPFKVGPTQRHRHRRRRYELTHQLLVQKSPDMVHVLVSHTQRTGDEIHPIIGRWFQIASPCEPSAICLIDP